MFIFPAKSNDFFISINDYGDDYYDEDNEDWEDDENEEQTKEYSDKLLNKKCWTCIGGKETRFLNLELYRFCEDHNNLCWKCEFPKEEVDHMKEKHYCKHHSGKDNESNAT